MHVQAILGEKGAKIVSIRPDSTILEACRLLAEHRIGAVLVLDGDQVAGILSERDLVRAVANQGSSCLDVALSDVMTRAVLTCKPTDTVDEVMAVMTANRVRHLPVLDDGKLAGIISIGDVVKYRLDEAALEVDSLREYVQAGR